MLLSLALVLGLEMSSRTNFESLALALRVKSVLGLGLGLGLEQKSLALAKQVIGLAGLVICQTNNTAMLKSTFIAWHCLIKCLLHELVPPLSYFFLVLCSLAPHNLKRSLNVFWCQVLDLEGRVVGLDLGLEAQVLVNNSALMALKSLFVSLACPQSCMWAFVLFVCIELCTIQDFDMVMWQEGHPLCKGSVPYIWESLFWRNQSKLE